VLEKITYDCTNFVTGYVFFTLGTFAGALCLLVRPDWRRQNRFLSGVGSFLVFYAISRTSPAIVDAVSGVRYAIIFLGAYLLTKLKPSYASRRSRNRLAAWTPSNSLTRSPSYSMPTQL
jgi:hypothetical protein